MAKITIEVPEDLVPDVYIAVGQMLRCADRDEAEDHHQADKARPAEQQDAGDVGAGV